MSSASFKEKILILLAEHERLIKTLLQDTPMLRGSFHTVHTRCGKSSCWCATAKEAHAHTRLTWFEEGCFITRKVPEAEADKITLWTKNFRDFKKNRRKLKALEARLDSELTRYEKARIKEVRKPLLFLTVRKRLAAQKKHRVPKTATSKK
jgi:hypothetical protein